MFSVGGADRFWAACALPVDDSARISMHVDGSKVRVGRLFGADGTIYYGQLHGHNLNGVIGDTGRHQRQHGQTDGDHYTLHGYGVRQRPDGTVTEGFWWEGTLFGAARTLSPDGRVEVGHYLEDHPNGRFWWWHPDGHHGYDDRWPAPVHWPDRSLDYDFGHGLMFIDATSGVRTAFAVDDDNIGGQNLVLGLRAPYIGRRRVDWPNGDYEISDWFHGDIYMRTYGIMTGDGTPIVLDAQGWDVEKHIPSPDCPYDGHVYAPVPGAKAFALWSHYILSGRSASSGGYEPARQAAFVTLVRRLLGDRPMPEIVCPFASGRRRCGRSGGALQHA
ncbi:hypothetical protein TW95_gp0950 [Pandoravirus inopinatum]|uniref:DUF5900 domain-containing protein n=1 Tax=Pandoravirus inopinatum TaxID=1605721 RepID=A0A0B5J2C6_9VIRU|nr:hypothetical protein TW95_gp0950 [Pandoravirus inopinatum]AJF97684.1 hypothetical protein [Pandoravirus inopinatum]